MLAEGLSMIWLQVTTFEEDMAKLKLTSKWLLTEAKRLVRAELKSQGLLAEGQPSVPSMVLPSFACLLRSHSAM